MRIPRLGSLYNQLGQFTTSLGHVAQNLGHFATNLARSLCVYSCTYVCMYACTYICVHVCVYLFVCLHVSVSVCVWLCDCVFVCVSSMNGFYQGLLLMCPCIAPCNTNSDSKIGLSGASSALEPCMQSGSHYWPYYMRVLLMIRAHSGYALTLAPEVRLTV